MSGLPGELPPELQRMLANGGKLIEQQQIVLVDEHFLRRSSYVFSGAITEKGEAQFNLSFDVVYGNAAKRYTIPFDMPNLDQFIERLAAARDAYQVHIAEQQQQG
jgi:hypothetical protein